MGPQDARLGPHWGKVVASACVAWPTDHVYLLSSAGAFCEVRHGRREVDMVAAVRNGFGVTLVQEKSKRLASESAHRRTLKVERVYNCLKADETVSREILKFKQHGGRRSGPVARVEVNPPKTRKNRL